MKMRCKLPMLLFFCFLVCTVLPIAPVWAHKVNLFAYVEKGTVYTESYFPDGRAVEKGKIEVFDSRNQKLLEGTTDNKGLFFFPIPKQDDLTLVLNATMGHKNSYVLKKEELGALPSEEKKEEAKKGQADSNSEAGKIGNPGSTLSQESEVRASPSLPCGEYQQLTRLIDEENKRLSEEMRQLKHEIAVLRQEVSRPGMSQIFAGIGYILGLAGVGFYVHTRKVQGRDT